MRTAAIRLGCSFQSEDVCFIIGEFAETPVQDTQGRQSMSEEPDVNEFLVSKFRDPAIAGAPETSGGTSIVNLTDIGLSQIN